MLNAGIIVPAHGVPVHRILAYRSPSNRILVLPSCVYSAGTKMRTRGNLKWIRPGSAEPAMSPSLYQYREGPDTLTNVRTAKQRSNPLRLPRVQRGGSDVIQSERFLSRRRRKRRSQNIFASTHDSRTPPRKKSSVVGRLHRVPRGT